MYSVTDIEHSLFKNIADYIITTYMYTWSVFCYLF